MLERKSSRRGLHRGIGDGRLRGRGGRLRAGNAAGHAVQPHHRLRRRALHRRLHRVLLHHQQRTQRLPARQLRRRLVARRLLQLLQRHPLLHGLHAVLLRSRPRQRVLRRLLGVPLRRRVRHAARLLQLLPLRAVPPGDRHHRSDRVPCSSPASRRTPIARVRVHHRARGRQLHRRARSRARVRAAARRRPCRGGAAAPVRSSRRRRASSRCSAAATAATSSDVRRLHWCASSSRSARSVRR